MLRILAVIGTCASLLPHATVAAPYTKAEGGIPMPDDFRALEATYQRNIRAALPTEGACTAENIAVRKSWDDLDDETKADYLRAVNCLAVKPALTDKALAPGVVNRLDDFTYIHINQTNIIHQSGYLLPWHRLFLWQMEEALRHECGYRGHLPYWDNARFSEDPTASKVWDGSATSFGGNGAYRADDHGPYTKHFPGLAADFSVPLPEGTGGGCVQDGPFKDLRLSLGPVVRDEAIDPDAPDRYGYAANPRCLSRNFAPGESAGQLTWANATALAGAADIAAFRAGLENLWHRQSHSFIGKEGADPFSPTNDPAFYVLHAQLDRLWAVWQGQDLAARTYAIDGNRTFFGLPLDTAPDAPPSLATINDEMDMGLGFRPKTREGMGMIEGGRCYIYE